MSSIASRTTAETPLEPIAPWWHTVLILGLVGSASLASFYQHGMPNLNLPGMSSRLSSYFTVIALEWVMAFIIWLELRRRGLTTWLKALPC
jgi:uncharacterized protein